MTTAVEETKPGTSVEPSGTLQDSDTPAGTAETINSPVVENTESRAMKEEVPTEKLVEPVAEKATEVKEPQVVPNVFTERERQFQADRDRAEAQLKNVYKQIMPYAEIDPATGRILGIREQVKQAQQQVPVGSQLDELMDQALLTGDKNSLKQVLNIFKQEIVQEAKNLSLQESQNLAMIDAEMSSIKKEYPNLFHEDGKPNYEDPLFIEAAKVVEKNQDLYHPLKVRAAIEIAEGRLLKRAMPSMTQQIKNDAQTKLKETLSNASIVSKPVVKEDSLNGLSPDQVSRLRKEGYDDSGIARIAKIYKQAAKEGGYTL